MPDSKDWFIHVFNVHAKFSSAPINVIYKCLDTKTILRYYEKCKPELSYEEKSEVLFEKFNEGHPTTAKVSILFQSKLVAHPWSFRDGSARVFIILILVMVSIWSIIYIMVTWDRYLYTLII